MSEAVIKGFTETEEGAQDHRRAMHYLSRNWQAMGRAGQATILGAALFATIMVMLATANAAYGGTCAGTPVAMAETTKMLPGQL